jgi:hypothetical protein
MFAGDLTIILLTPSMKHNPNPRHCLPRVRFWSPGLIAVSAKDRIDDLLRLSLKTEAQAMISEWLV